MLRFKKSLGQNFLIDKNIINKIISIDNLNNENILEIGPGSGNLTDFIIKEKVKKIIVIEKDESLVIPEEIDYDSFSGLSNEIKSKLKLIRPKTI